jgi:hypothetical protein
MANPGKPLSDGDLTGILSQQIRLAKSHDRAQREPSRARSIEYFLGTMKDTPSEPNRSSVVSRDLADTVGWILPGIMRVYTASDKMATVEPHLPSAEVAGMAPEQVDAMIQSAIAKADEATDGINKVFWSDNAGYRIVYNATWDALVVGNGIVKTYWDATPQYTTTLHHGLIQEQVDQLTDPDAGDEGGEAADNELPEVLAGPTDTGNTAPHPVTGEDVPTYDIKTRSKVAEGRIVIDCVSPEDFLIDGDAVTTEDARLTSHREAITRTDLIAMGYDPVEVNAIPRKAKLDTKEDIARNENDGGVAPDKSMDIVDYYECFARLDVDGDGEAELIRACLAGPDGQTMLGTWELWEDDSPFDDIPCEPIPHRWDARSIADETMDVQRIKTVLSRQALDNIYAVNNPQRQIEDGSVVNMDELFTPSFGGVVITKKGAMVQPLVVPFVANHAFDAINYQDQVIQRRTGVSRQTMALDPEALQNQSATANQNEKDASYSQIELLARNMAELGWKKVFAKILRLMVKHQADPQTIIIKRKARQIDPGAWHPDMPVNISVGLGTGSRDRDAAMLNTVLQQQIQLAERLSGPFPDKALEMMTYIHTTLTKFAESTGLKNPEMYWPSVTEADIAVGKQRLQQQASQMSPQLQLEQAKMQADTARGQAAAQVEQMKAQTDQQLTQAKIEAMQSASQIAQMKAQLEMRIEQMEYQENQQRAQAEINRSQSELQIKQMQFEGEQRAAGLQAQLDAAKLQIGRDKLQIAQMAIAEKADTADKAMALTHLTALQVAEINAGNDVGAAVLEAELSSAAGMQEHMQDVNLAEQAHQHALEQQQAAPDPTPAPSLQENP